jgi:hypothetical protein
MGKVQRVGQENRKISDAASTYFYLLLNVKYQSNNDYIWISFYEGLHRHTALLLSLTLSDFNLTKNEIKFKSLTTDYFQQQQLENIKKNSKQPYKGLSDVFDGNADAQMLTQPFNLKGIIPNKVEGTMSINAVAEFTKKSPSTVNSSATAKKRLRQTAYHHF